MAVINKELFVDGTLRAGNIKAGKITLTVPGTGIAQIVNVTVSGVGAVGSGNLFVQVTPWTTNPGGRVAVGGGTNTGPGAGGVIETSISGVSTTGFSIYMNRTTQADTTVLWFATRNP